MLELQLERLGRCRKMDRLMVATSVNPEDQAIEDICAKLGTPCFRGSLDDVLGRFYQAARTVSPDHVVRLTGDCPLADPGLIDELIDFYFKSGCDYVSNSLEPTLPDGLDAEVFSFDALERAWREAVLPSQREHVTLYIHSSPNRFQIRSWKFFKDLSRLRWTVDEPEDLELVRAVYENLYPIRPDFSWVHVLDLMEKRPELAELNTGFRRNEGLERSLARDQTASD
jgi:spore coat polysaccharide biosynthesis protein SpsF